MKKLLTMLLLLLMLLPSTLCEETPPAQEVTFADFSEKFADKFLFPGAEPIVTENSYQSEDVNITISTRRASDSDVYVVDIYVRSVECFLRGHAGEKYGKATAKVTKMAENRSAVIAMTGDSGHYFTKGWAISNGEINKDTPNRLRDLAIMYKDGVMVGVPNEDVDNDQIRADADAGKIWHIFLFGPSLLDEEGKARPKKEFEDCNVKAANPRSVIGYYEPGHYCFVQVDGRKTKSTLEKGKKNLGIKMYDLALLMEELGCQAAYNLDGGQSSMLWYGGEVISTPHKGGRPVGDIVYIKDLPKATSNVEKTSEGN